MPKLIDRYLIKEMLVPLIMGTLVIVLMFQANWLIALYKEYKLDRVPAMAIIQYILLKSPGFLQMTLPVGLAFASALTVSRVAREWELTAFRVAGISIKRALLPILFVGAVVGVANFYVGEKLIPQAEVRARQLLTEIGMLGSIQPMRQNVMLQLDRYAANFGSAVADGDKIILTDILLIERRPNQQLIIVRADQGVYLNGEWTIDQPILMLMQGGTVVTLESKKEPLLIREKISVPQFFMNPTPEEQTAEDIQQLIQQGKRQARDTTWLEVAYSMKFSVPASCLVFALTGPVAAIAFVRRGPFVGVLLSLLAVLLYYNLFVISTQILGRNGWLPPIAAAWLPNVILFVLGLIWLWRLE